MRSVFCLWIAFLLMGATWFIATSHGQVSGLYVPQAPGTPPDDNVSPTIELTVSPAAEPRPALKYRLLPALHERTPGNAAPRYYRALLMQKELPKEYWQQHADNYEAWHEATRDAFPKEEIAKWLAAQEHVLEEIRAAASREHCAWELRPQDTRGMEIISFRLPEIQECRNLARTIQLQARYETLSGRPEKAFELLRLGYQLARDTAEPPYLISGLVGIAIGQIMNAELLHLVEHSDANYYWAVSSLPQPLVDLRPAMEFEANMPFQMYPFLQDAETADRSPDEWRRLVLECIKSFGDLEGQRPAFSGWQAEIAAAAFAAKLYPVAKEQLLAAGMDRDKVEVMPVGQVIAIQTARSLRHAYDEIFKMSLLSYQEAAQMPDVTEEVLSREDVLTGRAGIPLAHLLLPAVQAVATAEVRMARNIAVLRTIEALRMHAAEHGGMLPAKLTDVTIVPVPNNPATGQPFPYQYDGDAAAATLDVHPVGNHTPRQDGKRYVIRIKK